MVIIVKLRYQVIDKFGITSEGTCKNFMVGFWCIPCSLLQMEYEVKNRPKVEVV